MSFAETQTSSPALAIISLPSTSPSPLLSRPAEAVPLFGIAAASAGSCSRRRRRRRGGGRAVQVEVGEGAG